MEVGLATLVILMMVLQALRVQEDMTTRRLAGLAVLSAVAVLVRDDLLVPVAVKPRTLPSCPRVRSPAAARPAYGLYSVAIRRQEP